MVIVMNWVQGMQMLGKTRVSGTYRSIETSSRIYRVIVVGLILSVSRVHLRLTCLHCIISKIHSALSLFCISKLLSVY